MDDLIITVTVDSSMSYPGNPSMPAIEDTDAVAAEYVRAIDAGASLVHHHGVHHLEKTMGPDGRKLSHIDFEGWKDLTEKIRSARNPIMQFGIASARLDEKVRLMDLAPDMMSYAFNVHDEYFRPDPAYPANEMYSLHPRDELEAFCQAAQAHHVKPEIECFYTGAFWNLEFIRAKGLLDDPIWATLLVGWPGGAWTPPTQASLLYLTQHLPGNTNWNLSVMDLRRSGSFCPWPSAWAATPAWGGRTTLICPTGPWPRPTRSWWMWWYGWPTVLGGVLPARTRRGAS